MLRLYGLSESKEQGQAGCLSYHSLHCHPLVTFLNIQYHQAIVSAQVRGYNAE